MSTLSSRGRVSTNPVQIPSRWERFKRLTVWHPINTDPRDEDRLTPKLWLPTYDLLAIGLGLYAYFLGSPLLNRLFPAWATDLASAALIVASVSCLIGVCFPRLSLLELCGKMVLVFLLGAYAGTVASSPRPDEPNGFVVIILVMAVWLLLPRITVLFSRVVKRSVVKREKMTARKTRCK